MMGYNGNPPDGGTFSLSVGCRSYKADAYESGIARSYPPEFGNLEHGSQEVTNLAEPHPVLPVLLFYYFPHSVGPWFFLSGEKAPGDRSRYLWFFSSNPLIW